MKFLKFILFIFLMKLFVFNIQAQDPEPILKSKVLMNAESFGFGPSAAIAEFFPYLRSEIKNLSFIGTGHTLDLQKKLNYNKIYDYYDMDEGVERQKFIEIAKHYDVFITACDFKAAGIAEEIGLKVIIYDPLTWYWKEIPKIITDSDLYISQNFLGVEERIERDFQKFPKNTEVIPAILSRKTTQGDLLVNLGGLSNPFLENKDITNFVRIVFGLIESVLKKEFNEIVYATSVAFVEATKDICNAKTFLPQEVQTILQKSQMGIMTSGLGNIYEASAIKKYVVWLPPANDSQGQQIKLLEKNNMVDFSIDWHDIFEDIEPINYFDEQKKVLDQIKIYMQRLLEDKKAQEKLKTLFENSVFRFKTNQGKISSLSKLVEIFNVDGAKQASKAIVDQIKRWEKKKNIIGKTK